MKCDNRYVAAAPGVGGFARKTAVVSFHAGGQPQSALKIPRQSDYAPIRLQRGITTDAAFEQWAQMMWWYPNSGALSSEVALDTFRKEVQIEVYNQAGGLMLRYDLHGC